MLQLFCRIPDDPSWTDFFTLTASRTFVRIDLCAEICYSDCSIRAGLLAFLTANTAYITSRSYCFTLCMGTASHKNLLFVWNQLDQMSWTLCHTLPTGFTGFPVHHCYTIDHMDSIKRTDLLRSFQSQGSHKCTS